MSNHDEDFKDSTSVLNLVTILTVLIFMPLLPMLMGWFTMLR
ncbi:hypothetical protein [Colwellia echini]|nr:hypothetical protein [Colwellia echini]